MLAREDAVAGIGTLEDYYGISPGVSGIPLTNPSGQQFGPVIAATQAGALLVWRNPFATEESGVSNDGLSIYPFGH